MNFTDEELETWMRLQKQADDYLNLLIRRKRVEELGL